MEKRFFLITIALFTMATVLCQSNTEVYLFDLNMGTAKPTLSNPKNISNNVGYDNQPSFLDDNTILFSSTRADQTDILKFNITNGSTSTWITDTPTGSEYSPLKIPNKNAVSAIRLDLNGLQRLYEYNLKSGVSELLLKDLKVGYHMWYNDHIIVSTVLVDNRMDLVVSNLKEGSDKTLQKNVGRNLLKIPNSDLISYISKENNPMEIKSLHPILGTTKSIATTYNASEDICWLKDGTILTGFEKSILRLDPTDNEGWQTLVKFDLDEINNISRIAVNENANRLAFVAEESPVVIVQKQLDAYNARDIDAFMDTYSNNIELYNFPNKSTRKGKEAMREGYAGFFENTPDLHCEIKNRIVIGNKVIDEEYITANGKSFSAVAIYEVENGKIAKVTFLQ